MMYIYTQRHRMYKADLKLNSTALTAFMLPYMAPASGLSALRAPACKKCASSKGDKSPRYVKYLRICAKNKNVNH